MCSFFTFNQGVTCLIAAGRVIAGFNVGAWTVTPDFLMRWAQEEQENVAVVTEHVGERVKPIAMWYIVPITTYQIGLVAA